MSSPFSLTFCNPSRVFDVASDVLSPLRFLARLVWPLAIFAGIAGAFNWYDLKSNLDLALSTFSFLQNLVLSMLTANLLSRLVMGLTMAWYGIAPHQFGIRMLFGVIPRFFVSMGQIRQLDYPQQRRCYAAPLLTRLGLFAIGVTTWVLMRRGGTGAADAALVLGATGLAAFLFTLNPIWRADGYHWMAAWFRIPDLREQSYRLLGLILRGKPIPEMLSKRAVRGLMLYALASIVFTAVLIYLILTTVAFALEEQFRGTGVVMFAVIVSMMLAFLISRRGHKKGDGKEKRQRAMAQFSHPADVSCYTDPVDLSVEASPASSDLMARKKSRSKAARIEDGHSIQVKSVYPELDDILPAKTDAASAAGGDADLESILGPVSTPKPRDEFDEIVEAALAPAPVAAAPPASARASRSAPRPPDNGPKASDNLDSVLRIGKGKRKKTSGFRKILIWAILLGGLYYIAIQPYPYTVGGDFIVQPVEYAQVRARTDGEIVQINVTEGDWVNEGDVMAVLSKWDEERDIAILEADLARLTADLETLTAGPRLEEVAVAEQELTSAKTREALALLDLQRKQQLFDLNTVPQRTLDEAKSTHDLAISAREQATARLNLLKLPALDSKILSAKANIQRKEQELAFSKLQLEHTNIRAATHGQVVSTLDNVAIGSFLREGDLFANLADNRTVNAAIEVPETEIDDAAIGAEVIMKPWSAPDKNITGTVKRMAPVAEEREFGQVVRVIVEVSNTEGALSRNMTGFGKIIVEERPVWEVFTRVFIRFFRIEMWSWLP